MKKKARDSVNELQIFENGYCPTSDGQIYSKKTNRFLRQTVGKDGYARFGYSIDGKIGSCLVHRLVATVFIPNPNNLPQVNHKDEDKTNNAMCNLEWCTPKYNCNYGEKAYKYAKSRNAKTSKRHCGVGFHKRDKVWFAYIRVSGKLKHLGNYETEKEAVDARKDAELKYYGKYC